MRSLRRFFSHNQSTKLGSFVAAVFLWLFAVSGATRTGLFPGSIPLSIEHTPDGLIATANVESVRVRLAADPAVWRQLTPSAITATVDLAGQAPGLNALTVRLAVSVPNVQVVEVIPKTVEVQLEPRATARKVVEVTTRGEPASGLFASEAIVEPAEVTVTGGQSILDRVDRLTAVIDVAGATSDRDETVAVQALDTAGHALSGVGVSPATVRVHQPLTKLAASKTVGIRVVTTGAPPAGKLVTPVTTQPATATLTGSAAQLAGISTLATRPIDLASIAERTTVRASLEVPAGLMLVNAALVDVTFEVSEHDASRALTPKVVFTGLAADRHVTSVEPAAPILVVRGPASVLGQLQGGEGTVTIDLAGRGVGQVTVSLDPALLHLPDAVTLQQLLTQSLVITIQ